MFDEAIVEMSTGQLVRLPELSARLAVGEKGPVSPGLVVVLGCSPPIEYSATSNVGDAEPNELFPRQRQT